MIIYIYIYYKYINNITIYIYSVGCFIGFPHQNTISKEITWAREHSICFAERRNFTHILHYCAFFELILSDHNLNQQTQNVWRFPKSCGYPKIIPVMDDHDFVLKVVLTWAEDEKMSNVSPPATWHMRFKQRGKPVALVFRMGFQMTFGDFSGNKLWGFMVILSWNWVWDRSVVGVIWPNITGGYWRAYIRAYDNDYII